MEDFDAGKMQNQQSFKAQLKIAKEEDESGVWFYPITANWLPIRKQTFFCPFSFNLSTSQPLPYPELTSFS